MSTVLLQRYRFDGNLTSEGSLNLALQNTATTLGTPTYTTGPVAGTQGIAIPVDGKSLQLPFHSSLNFDKGILFSFGGWFKHTGATAQIMGNYTAPSGFTAYTVNENMIDSETTANNTRTGFTYAAFPGGINRWIHWWFTYDGQNLKTYADGALLGSFSSGASSFASTSGWVLSGIRTGFIADVRWYSGVVLPATAQAAVPLTGITFSTTPYTAKLTYPAVASASYVITSTPQPNEDISRFSTIATSYTVGGLIPGKQYLFQVLSVVGGVQTLQNSGTVTLPAATGTASDFTKTALLVATSTGVSLVNLNLLKGVGNKEAIVAALLSTNDIVSTSASTRVSPIEASVVQVNDTAPVKINSSLYVPFDATSTSTTQTITLTLRSGATQLVFYDTATEKVTINGIAYSAGEKLLLDGQVLQILEAA